MQRYYSNIYWHFTGSPIDINWDKVKKPGDILTYGKPKTDLQAVKILMRILSTGKILASCREKITDGFWTQDFCCVCDIPFKDLPYHARYYGKVAIGFSASSIHRYFNPVFYLNYHKVFEDEDFVSSLNRLINNLQEEKWLLSFIKITRFDEHSSETFYTEREWRHLGSFCFEPVDVAAIIVPRSYISRVRNFLLKQGYQDDIPVISWEVVKKA